MLQPPQITRLRKDGTKVNSHSKNGILRQMVSIAVLVTVAVVLLLGCSNKPANTAAAAPQKTFATPAEAGQALHNALQANDDKTVTQRRGAKAKTLVSAG